MKVFPFHSLATRRASAFTLLEVLVSSAILAVLVILLVAMGNGATHIWRDGERRRETVREARAGLEMISEDLHSAVLTTNPATLTIKEESNKKEGPGGERLFMLVSHPREKRAAGNDGDICATGYFVARDPMRNGTLNLYRFHVSGKPVTKAFERGELPELYASASPSNALTTELLARNIVELDVHRIPESPALLMLSLSALGGDTSRLIASDLGAKERNQRLLNQHLQRFTTFVKLPSERELTTVP